MAAPDEGRLEETERKMGGHSGHLVLMGYIRSFLQWQTREILEAEAWKTSFINLQYLGL
jgi:hypothetical protein